MKNGNHKSQRKRHEETDTGSCFDELTELLDTAKVCNADDRDALAERCAKAEAELLQLREAHQQEKLENEFVLGCTRDHVKSLEIQNAEVRSALQAWKDNYRIAWSALQAMNEYVKAHEADIIAGMNDFGTLRPLLSAPSPARSQEGT